ncbi:hypothetical protein K280104A7_33300 [Candidatus Bariatricus faecipullorum]
MEHNYGNNQIIGFLDETAIVYDYEKDGLFWFETSAAPEDLIGTCVESDILQPISSLSDNLKNRLSELINGEKEE